MTTKPTLVSLLWIAAFSGATDAARVDPNKLTGLALGQHVFLTYCAGCHGFDGLAYLPGAPSFAMGDRLKRSNAELLRSIMKGKGAMPSWENKLPAPWLEAALKYVRHLSSDGIRHRVRPEFFYVFPPPGTDFVIDWSIPPSPSDP